MTHVSATEQPWFSSFIKPVCREDPAAMTLRFGRYARISHAEDELGVTRQLNGMDRDLPKDPWLRGRTVEWVDDYIDNDVSAFDTKAQRAQFQRLIGDIQSGRINAVAAWDLDRLVRQPYESEMFVRAMQQFGGLMVLTTNRENVDFITDEGIDLFRMKATFANIEVRKGIRRVKEKHLELAAAGAFAGGKRRYGYTENMSIVVPFEADILREVAKRLLAGESASAICRDLNAREVPTALGKKWAVTSLQRCVMGPHVVGLRLHHGNAVQAAWPAILDQETWQQLQVLKNDPIRRGRGGYGKPISPLSGLMRCGRCSQKLRMQKSGRKGYDEYFWQCNSPAGCHGINRSNTKISSWIIGEVLAAYRDDAFVERMAANGQDVSDRVGKIAQMRGAEAMLEEVEAAYWFPKPGDLRMDKRIYEKAKIAHEKTIESIKRELRQMTHTDQIDPDLLFSGELDEKWVELPLYEQHALIALLVDSVVVHQVGSRRKDLGREDHYSINWLDEPSSMRPTS